MWQIGELSRLWCGHLWQRENKIADWWEWMAFAWGLQCVCRRGGRLRPVNGRLLSTNHSLLNMSAKSADCWHCFSLSCLLHKRCRLAVLPVLAALQWVCTNAAIWFLLLHCLHMLFLPVLHACSCVSLHIPATLFTLADNLWISRLLKKKFYKSSTFWNRFQHTDSQP